MQEFVVQTYVLFLHYSDTIKAFLKNEIIHYPLPHQTALESIPAFSTASLSSDLVTDKSLSQQPDDTLRAHWHTTFHTRIIQHNLRITSLYYRRIKLTRLSQLLSLSSAEAENQISQIQISVGSSPSSKHPETTQNGMCHNNSVENTCAATNPKPNLMTE